MTVDSGLVSEIRRALKEMGDPLKAEGMRAYMKSEMPYRGVQKPARRKMLNALFRSHPIEDKVIWRGTALELWRNAAHREERYSALALVGANRYAAFRTFDTMPMLGEMVVTGAWWDYVDEIATHRLRELLERYPKGLSRRMRSWSTDSNMWKRRCSIICQVNRKGATDVGLLFDCIEPNLPDAEFFIRKAIGWALRDLAWTDLDTVEDYVERNHHRLSPLSRREALKNRQKIREPLLSTVPCRQASSGKSQDSAD